MQGERRGGEEAEAEAWPTLAVVLSTTFLVVRSLLLPTSSLLTFSLA